MRPIKDKELNQLAHDAQTFAFEQDLAEDIDAGRNALETTGGSKGIYSCFNNPNRWMVLFFVGGKQQTLAYANSIYQAAKLHDVLMLHFAIYRRPRSEVEHVDACYNFSKRDAQITLDRYPKIKTWLYALQNYLQTSMKLETWEVKQKRKGIESTEASTIRKQRRTLNGQLVEQLGELHGAIMDSEKILKGEIADLKKQNEELFVLMKRLLPPEQIPMTPADLDEINVRLVATLVPTEA